MTTGQIILCLAVFSQLAGCFVPYSVPQEGNILEEKDRGGRRLSHTLSFLCWFAPGILLYWTHHIKPDMI